MAVILAQPRGFPTGMVRAFTTVAPALGKYRAPVPVRPEIVRNAHLVERKKAKGARHVEDLTEILCGAPSVAPGISRALEAEAADLERLVLAASSRSAEVHPHGVGHPEVARTLGRIHEPVDLAELEEDVAALKLAPDTRLAYVTQAIWGIEPIKLIVMARKRRFSDVLGAKTKNLCFTTQKPAGAGVRGN
ncbi:MAG: hypothetical protein WA636_10120 [Methylovirgula sp.]